jgi:hypothetical protein
VRTNSPIGDGLGSKNFVGAPELEEWFEEGKQDGWWVL